MRSVAAAVLPEMLTDPLPADWARARTPDGRVYYWHTATRGVQYERPAPLPAGWRLARCPKSGLLYLWHVRTRQVAPYVPGQPLSELSLGQAAALKRSPSKESELSAATTHAEVPDGKKKRLADCLVSDATGRLATRVSSVESAGDVIMSGAMTVEADEATVAVLTARCDTHYATVTTDARFRWFERGEEGTLLLKGTADLRDLAALKRGAESEQVGNDAGGPSLYDLAVSFRGRGCSTSSGASELRIRLQQERAVERWEDALLSALSRPHAAPKSAARALDSAAATGGSALFSSSI